MKTKQMCIVMAALAFGCQDMDGDIEAAKRVYALLGQ